MTVPVVQLEYHQVMFSIPARLIKKATSRNKIRRRLRESYRRNKSSLYSDPGRTLSYLLAYVYISSHMPVQKILEEQVIASLNYLLKKR